MSFHQNALIVLFFYFNNRFLHIEKSPKKVFCFSIFNILVVELMVLSCMKDAILVGYIYNREIKRKIGAHHAPVFLFIIQV